MRLAGRLCGSTQIFSAYAHDLSVSAKRRIQSADFDDLFLCAQPNGPPDGFLSRNMGFNKTTLRASAGAQSSSRPRIDFVFTLGLRGFVVLPALREPDQIRRSSFASYGSHVRPWGARQISQSAPCSHT